MVRPRFTLRALLVVLTLAAVALGIWGAKLAEERRQERLWNEAMGLALKEGNSQAVWPIEGELPKVELSGGTISPTTARALAAAETVGALVLTAPLSDEVKQILATGYKQHEYPDPGVTYSYRGDHPPQIDEPFSPISVDFVPKSP